MQLIKILPLICLATSPTAFSALGDNLPKQTTRPSLTNWGPQGERIGSNEELNNPILPEGDRFITIHGGVRSNDEVNIVFAPVFEETWNAESNALVTESPVFGGDNSSYFIPANATDNGENVLIKVSPDGVREFTLTNSQLGSITYPGTDIELEAKYGLGSSPIVLNDPSTGKEVVYGATYTRAYAADEDGNLLWNTAIMPASITAALADSPEALAAELAKPHRMFGTTYHPAVDAIIVADISGDVMAFDRQTGEQVGAFQMPGSPAKGGDNAIFSSGGGLGSSSLPFGQQLQLKDKLTELAINHIDLLYSDSGIELESSADGGAAALAVLGGGAVIGNQISVDPDTNSLWVASTDSDEADGTVDGASERGALFRLDLTRNGDEVIFNEYCRAPFDGGTTSTPAVSADGQRIYTTDNFGSAIAIDRDCQRAWELDVGQAAVASLAVSSEVGAEIYYPTLTSIYKIQENATRDGAELVWEADLNSSFLFGNVMSAIDVVSEGIKNNLESDLGFGLPGDTISFGASNLDLATIGQNGIMVHSGYGLRIKVDEFSVVLPIAINNALYDRETGEFINGTRALEENIGAMYTAADGTIIMGSSPIRRAVVRGIVKSADFYLPELPPLLEEVTDNLIDFIARPMTGGITKYGVTQRFDLIARDASCQAEKRLINMQSYMDNVSNMNGVNADINDIKRLIRQAKEANEKAYEINETIRFRYKSGARRLDNAIKYMDREKWSTAGTQLSKACSTLTPLL